MPRILTTCPNSGGLVPTGHRSPAISLDDMDAPRAFRCPSCEQVHSWTADQAVVEETLSLAAFRSAA
jgi:hypothetical protein